MRNRINAYNTEQCELCGGLYKHADTSSAKYLCEFKPRQTVTTPPITERLAAHGYRPKQFQTRPKYLLWWSEHFWKCNSQGIQLYMK